MSGITYSQKKNQHWFDLSLQSTCVLQHGQATHLMMTEKVGTKSNSRTNNKQLLVGGI